MIQYILYGVWNVANIGLVWMLRTIGIPLNVSPGKEVIAWWTTEIVTIITGLSVTVAFILGLIKLFEWLLKKFGKR